LEAAAEEDIDPSGGTQRHSRTTTSKREGLCSRR